MWAIHHFEQLLVLLPKIDKRMLHVVYFCINFWCRLLKFKDLLEEMKNVQALHSSNCYNGLQSVVCSTQLDLPPTGVRCRFRAGLFEWAKCRAKSLLVHCVKKHNPWCLQKSVWKTTWWASCLFLFTNIKKTNLESNTIIIWISLLRILTILTELTQYWHKTEPVLVKHKWFGL